MRNLILYIIIFLGIIICASPLIDGYFFKKIYYQQISLLQQEIQSQMEPSAENNREETKIQIDSYDLGWLQSTANLSITNISHDPSHPIPPIVFHFKSIIHHGPLVNFDKNIQFAYATIETYFYLPDFLNQFVPQNPNGFMQVNTLVSLSGNTWTNYFNIPAKSFNQFGSWDGVSGVTSVNLVNNMIAKVTTNIVFGKLYISPPSPAIPAIAIEPIKADSVTIPQTPTIYDGTANVNMPGALVKWQDGSVFSLSKLISNVSYGIRNNLYQYNSVTSIGSIQLPPYSPIANLSNIFFTFSINDLNIGEAAKRYKAYWNHQSSNPSAVSNSLLQILAPTSNVKMKIDMTTELGAASANLNLSLLAMPQTENDLNNNLIANFNARVTQPVIEKIIASYIRYLYQTIPPSTAAQMQTNADPSSQAQMIINSMIQRGYIQQDKNDYIVSLNKKGAMTLLNDKAMSDADLQMIPMNIHSDFMRVVMPNAANPAATTATITPTTTPAAGIPPTAAPTTSPATIPISTQVPPTVPATAASITTPATTNPAAPNSAAVPAAAGPATAVILPPLSGRAPTSSMPTPTTIAAPDAPGNHCYWMDSSSGKNIWVLIPYTDKAKCFALDSCSGGQGESGGGCYKWAASVNAKAEPWNTP